MEKGVKSLASNWFDWNDIMSNSESTAYEISNILPEINAAIQDILNIDNQAFALLPTNFAKDNWKLINDVVNGVEGAVDELRDKAGEQILLNISVSSASEEELKRIHNIITSFDHSQFTVGVAIDPVKNKEFINACNTLIA